MSSSPLSKVAGIHPRLPTLPHTPPSGDAAYEDPPDGRPAAVQDWLASWISDLTALHDLTERLGRTNTLSAALHETLRAGAQLAGAQRGLISLRSADGLGPDRLFGGPGNDIMGGNIGTDRFDGGSEIDVCLRTTEEQDLGCESVPQPIPGRRTFAHSETAHVRMER
jgi:hypothetical protein